MSRELQVSAESYGRDATRLRARVLEFDRAARVRRALSIGLPLLGLALLSLPIPGWHFIGVPGFAIASFVLARRRLAQELEIEEMSGPCPACASAQAYPVPGAAPFPLTLACPGCQEFLKLSLIR